MGVATAPFTVDGVRCVTALSMYFWLVLGEVFEAWSVGRL